ncbi:hypothetical protein A0M37_02600 [Campylobacter jejuni]|uniref:hypothetical protein n=1 Tax=Campylobacter TaxID=194 RepID=UPI00087439F6|nr:MULTISPECIES: hypothetical protein [Campylobacter]EDN5861327.1 hypothetical protein [Campylobacter coli]EAH4635811.1 hypothetical protein [Campylobacter jejuni]EAJ1912739.1 hypothetical protein [Campylobacter jejuni]EAK7961458.1 hypothetical protein [Campylobacter jejuni]EAL8918172.1 hypothetical protein [Campylobacter jejuni]
MKTLKEKIEVMEAFKNGKQVQVKDTNSDWHDVKEPQWNWLSCDYRVKPREELKYSLTQGDYYVCVNKSNKYYYGKVYKFVESKLETKQYLFRSVDTLHCEKFCREYILEEDLKDFMNILDDRIFWFWEVKVEDEENIKVTLRRLNYNDMKENEDSYKIEYARPIYSLGFILRDKKGNLDLDGFFKV